MNVPAETSNEILVITSISKPKYIYAYGKTKFDECIENRIHKIREILSAKAGEYATDYNRFHNFDVAARILDCTPEQALRSIMIKHIVSVLDLVQGAEEVDQTKAAVIDEKIGDTINYLILLEGLLLRRLEST